jgi:phosphohistidine phosphatase
MKTLYLIRHAKSSWSFTMNDHDRPLGERGRRDVFKMGMFISSKIACPDKMISSTASRAFYTALFIADRWHYSEEKIELSAEMFHASPSKIIEILKSQTAKSIAIVGHNPGFTDLYNLLTASNLEKIPTCGIVGINFEMESWEALDKTIGKEICFYTPNNI